MAQLSDDIRCLKGIGEQRAKALSKLGINTLGELITYFPRSYEDRSKILPIAAVSQNETVCVSAIVVAEPSLSRVRRGMELLKLRVCDETGSIDITYFNQSFIKNQLKEGQSYIFCGKINHEGSRRTMTNPLFEPEDAPRLLTGRIVPVYRLTAGISQKLLISLIRQGLELCRDILPDPLPESVSERFKLCKPAYAFENIHFPADAAALELSRRRLVFEELFVLTCALTRIKDAKVRKSGIIVSSPRLEDFLSALPFIATGAQRRAIEEAFMDMRSGRLMNRLISGDVGSGKTLVAAACIWAVHEGGLQTAFMAPTEILVNQHHATFNKLLSPFGVKVAKITGSMTAKQRREVTAKLKEGEITLLVGTHAILSEDVEFLRLALVITDEQHRFGVNQRAALVSKGSEVHTLVMSATPIPRTLALMVYGDLDVSVIDEMPPGRQKVDTFVVGEDMRERIYVFIRKLVSQGRQVFIVCPAVEENEERPREIKSAVEYSKKLSKEIFPDLRVGCVHGKMKASEKDAVMDAFVDGGLHIIVATTVVEVGVDVPNAALMVVENAEYFGLGQLHQLRGRVGRGEHKSYCVLFSDFEGEQAKARLKVLEKESDGFKIAEEDLKQRGPGDFFGGRQHGLPQMKIADLCTDLRIFQAAQEAGRETLRLDPGLKKPENRALKQKTDELFSAFANTFN